MPESKDRRVERWALQAGARALLPGERVSWCYRNRVPGQSTIDVWWAEAVKRAHFKNLMVCGSIWSCPICAAKITERRRVELTEAIDHAQGLDTALVTFTMHHDRRDKLHDLLDDLLASYRFMKAGRIWAGIERDYKLVGSVRALEVTQWLNGWHPHLHVLFFAARGADFAGLGGILKERWLSILDTNGCSASDEVGVQLSDRRGDVARYIAKFGHEPKQNRWTVEHELTKAPSKLGTSDHRTPTQLLRDYVNGDKGTGNLWREYALTFKGKRQLVWSRGLRHALGLDKEKTDEELAKSTDEPSVLLGQISLAQWRVILANDARAEVLEVASSGDAGALAEFIQTFTVKTLPARKAQDMTKLHQVKALDSARERRKIRKECFDRMLSRAEGVPF